MKVSKRTLVLLGTMSLFLGCGGPPMTPYLEKEQAIWDHMKRYGVNRDDMASLRQLQESVPHGGAELRQKIPAERIFSPGGTYRVEMDEFVATLLVPDARAGGASWFWPYTNTRTPDAGTKKEIDDEKGNIVLAGIGWYYGPIWSSDYQMGMNVTYSIRDTDGTKGGTGCTTPEAMLQRIRLITQRLMPTQAELERLQQGEHNTDLMWRVHYLTHINEESRIVLINGRYWLYSSANYTEGGRSYSYVTCLASDRTMSVTFSMPRYNYTANPDRATYPAPIKKAFADMEAMVASLRAVNLKDDGKPDPFVVERSTPPPASPSERRPTDAAGAAP